jgi:hypothetical protein
MDCVIPVERLELESVDGEGYMVTLPTVPPEHTLTIEQGLLHPVPICQLRGRLVVDGVDVGESDDAVFVGNRYFSIRFYARDGIRGGRYGVRYVFMSDGAWKAVEWEASTYWPTGSFYGRA